MVLLTLLDWGLSGKCNSQMSPIPYSPGEVQNSGLRWHKIWIQGISSSVPEQDECWQPAVSPKSSSLWPRPADQCGEPRCQKESAPHACAVHTLRCRACPNSYSEMPGQCEQGTSAQRSYTSGAGQRCSGVGGEGRWRGGALSQIPYSPVLGRYTGPQ